MQITLMRHGEPRLPKTKWVTPRGMKQWIENYDNSDVETDSIPHECFIAAAGAKLIATSTLKRAESSSHALGQEVLMKDSVFSEAELPYALWPAPYCHQKLGQFFLDCYSFAVTHAVLRLIKLPESALKQPLRSLSWQLTTAQFSWSGMAS